MIPGTRRLVVRRRRRKQIPAIGCEDAQEAISARLDREWHPAQGAPLGAHLANCLACRDFDADIASLGRRAGLRSPRPAPAALVATLVPLVEAGRRPLLAGARLRRDGHGFGSGWARTVRWAVATVPAVVVFVALPLGVGSKPRLVPTRPPSPCTAGLVARHTSRRG